MSRDEIHLLREDALKWGHKAQFGRFRKDPIRTMIQSELFAAHKILIAISKGSLAKRTTRKPSKIVKKSMKKSMKTMKKCMKTRKA